MTAVIRRIRSSLASPQMPAMPHMSGVVSRDSLFRGEDKQVPADPRRQQFLHTEREPVYQWILVQRKVRDIHAETAEVRKKPVRLRPGESKCDGAFRSIGAVVNEVFRSQVAPSFPEK